MNTKENQNNLVLIGLVIIFFIVGGGVLWNKMTSFDSSKIDYLHQKKSLPNAEEKLDQEYRTAITISYCNILRKQDKVKIEDFNECTIKKYNPLQIYTLMTGKQLTKNWENLALNEKALVVQEVQSFEIKF